MCRVSADADGLRTSLPHPEGLRHALPRLHLHPHDGHPDPPPPDEDHTFASCQACEWKGWFKEGADVPLGKVLSLASERRF
jgi:hypothetical protein